jgi:KDO2-lipid IV(A) lauroyltransferase
MTAKSLLALSLAGCFPRLADGSEVVPHLYVLGALGRRIDRLPGLRENLWRLEGVTLARIWRTLGSGDPDTISDRGARLGRALGPHLRKQRHVLGNLAVAFPHWTKLQYERTARDVWGNIGRTVLEYSCLSQICDPVEDRVRVVDLGGLDHVRSSGRPAIFVAPHLANWNLLPLAASRAGIPLTVVYRRQSNPHLESLMPDWRQSLGCGFLEVGDGWQGMLRALRDGRSIGLLMDQRYDSGVALPFFGTPAPTTVLPARLALRLGVPLIPARIERRRGANFVITVHRPVDPVRGYNEPDAAMMITTQVNGLFERWITAAPDQWYCPKRRWPRPGARKAKHTKFLAGAGQGVDRNRTSASSGEAERWRLG